MKIDVDLLVQDLVSTLRGHSTPEVAQRLREAVATTLKNHGVGNDTQAPGNLCVLDTFDHVIKAASRAGIAISEMPTHKDYVCDVSDRMAEEIITLRAKVSNREAELREANRHTLVPVAGRDNAYSSLRRVLDAAYEQAATGKGAERHANARSFESQPMQSISDLLGDNHGLLFQAVKKIQESTHLPHYRQRERELLGAINYIAGAIIFDTNQSAPEELDAED